MYTNLFVKIEKSQYPGILVKQLDIDPSHNDSISYLISIVEYYGDYIIVNHNDIAEISLRPEDKLSILGKFGNWYYKQHPDIFQQVILENLQTFS